MYDLPCFLIYSLLRIKYKHWLVWCILSIKSLIEWQGRDLNEAGVVINRLILLIPCVFYDNPECCRILRQYFILEWFKVLLYRVHRVQHTAADGLIILEILLHCYTGNRACLVLNGHQKC